MLDIDSSTTVRLQIWDTAGQERFRSISKLYYRGASAVLLVYSIVDEQSFEEMGRWLMELRTNLGDDIVVHVVGTKTDVVAQDPSQRKVPFERCIAYVADHFHPAKLPTTPITPGGAIFGKSLDSKRSSGFWGQDIGWDCCHEISAKDGEGIEEVFRVITRKLVEQRNRRVEQEQALTPGITPGDRPNQAGYFDQHRIENHGSFRPRLGDRRRSWLGFPTPNIATADEGVDGVETDVKEQRGRCC